MKKIVIASFATVFALIVLLFITSIFVSFKTIKPTTEAINRDLKNYFSKIIYIPEGIPPPQQTLDKTEYFWEMETPQGEVTGIRLKYDPSFTKGKNTIQVTLEMPENGDPSIFNKVLPAVISDKQSLDSARDPQKANLNANQELGYEKLSLFTKKETNQTTKIIWEFKKESLGNQLNEQYSKLYRYPPALLKILYNIPSLTLGLLAG